MGREGIPQVSDMHFQITPTSDQRFSSVRQAHRLEDKKRKKEESLVKYKSADKYVERPNNRKL